MELLHNLCEDFDVVRKGGNSDASSRIDLGDPAVQFVLL